jgi:hypothetical protein
MSFNPIDFAKDNLESSNKQAAEMQQKLTEMQQKLAALKIEGNSGLDNYSVKVCLNGKYEAVEVSIDPLLLNQNIEMLNDLVAAAITDAAHKTESAIQREFMVAMQGIKLPGQ